MILYTSADLSITPLEEVTTHKHLTTLNNYLNRCAASLHSNLGDRTAGYLVITDPHAMFAITSAVPFITTVNYGPTVTIPDPDPTAAVFGSLTRTHNKYLRVFNEYHNSDKACKKVLSSLTTKS